MEKFKFQNLILLALALLFFGFSIIPSCGRKSSNNQATPTPTATSETESLGEFSTQTVENKGTGDRFQIKKIEYENGPDFERVILTLDKTVADGELPGYKVEELGQEIRVLLYDTRDVDENLKNVFEGSKSIAGSGGNVIKVDLWYPEDDTMIGAKIHLSKTAGFRVRQGEDPLRLIIEIEKK